MTKPLHLAFVFAIACSASIAWGVEPARDFLQGLRARGYHDIALEYLDAMATSPLAPVELKLEIDLEKAITLIEASRSQRDRVARAKSLNDAEALLTKFTTEKAAHPKANTALNQLGSLIVERARMKVDQSKNAENKEQLLKEANALYEKAFGVFTDLQETLKTKLQRIPKVLDPKNKQQAKMIETRTQLRADFLQTLLLAAAVREEMADTLKDGSPEFKKMLEEAAALYKEIYTKYRTRLAGLYARMYQGRANQRLGKLKDALGYYTELLDQPDDPIEFRILKTKTLRLAMECWLHETQKKYLEAIKQADPWISKSRPQEDSDPDWQAIRMSLARAYVIQADAIKVDDPGNTRAVTQSISTARRHASFLAKRSGEFQEQARQLVADLGGPDRTDEKPAPTNFAEAVEAGKDALNAFTTAELIVEKVPARIQSETDQAEKDKLQKQLAAAQQTLASAQQEAIDYYRLALQLVDNETSTEDVNVVRYFLAYLYYKAGDPYKAALMGEFVSRRFPDSAGARDCAAIAMASYAQIYAEVNGITSGVFKQADQDSNGSLSTDELQAAQLDGGADKDGNGSVSLDELAERYAQFEMEKIVYSAEYIVEKWPDHPTAQDALTTLVPFMINSSQLDRAQQYAAQMPESSQKRGEAELKTGKAMWGTYLRDTGILRAAEEQETTQVDIAAEKQRLDALRQQAHDVLSAGFDRVKDSATPVRDTVTAVLSLAQVSLELQQPGTAVAALEHPKLGALTLARAKHASVSDAAVKEEVYKTALRAYISSLATDENAITKAEAVMNEMKSVIGGDAAGEKRLISVYVGLAQDLEKQMTTATPEAKRALAQGFESFLNQLSAGATDLSVLNWVAESFAKLGGGLDDGATLNDEAKKYYTRADEAFKTILDKVQLDDKTKIQLHLRRATLAGQMRDFAKALEAFKKVLADKPATLNVQVDAAKLLEVWAKQPGQEARYMDAIKGILEPGQAKPIIWGWGKIANTTSKYPNFKDTFHEARVHVAECRFNYAQTKSGDEKAKLLKDAVRDISLTRRLYPDLGGDAWKARYDDLLKKIQQAQGERAIGLRAFESPTAAGG